ncbi:hypothetical protein A2U01_0097054, partial [Trifolium medium]|nr:hypothetical protein [Trifolium medium]
CCVTVAVDGAGGEDVADEEPVGDFKPCAEIKLISNTSCVLARVAIVFSLIWNLTA